MPVRSDRSASPVIQEDLARHKALEELILDLPGLLAARGDTRDKEYRADAIEAILAALQESPRFDSFGLAVAIALQDLWSRTRPATSLDEISRLDNCNP
jgi:hypothetical protein